MPGFQGNTNPRARDVDSERDRWYAWQDSNLRPVAPEESASKSLNSLSLFLLYTYTFSGSLLSL